MENQLADYGIFLSECARHVPKKVGYFEKFSGEDLSVAVSHDEDDDIGPLLFRFGFNRAEMRAVQAPVDTDSEGGASSIQDRVDGVRASVDRFQQPSESVAYQEVTNRPDWPVVPVS